VLTKTRASQSDYIRRALEAMNVVTQFLFLKIFHVNDRSKFGEDSDISHKLIIIAIRATNKFPIEYQPIRITYCTFSHMINESTRV
jgi:hypothetical protein